MHAACDRARQWATADVDGELSRFELVLLRAHLDACPSCREFHTAIGGISRTLRATPFERLERAIEIGSIRRRLRPRLAPAAAAMAVVAVVLGSGVVSTELRSGSVRDAASRATPNAVEAVNLISVQALAKPASGALRVVSRPQGSLRGGPVVRDR
jgi:predicted anti-sigma-YlaC factor YlaD